MPKQAAYSVEVGEGRRIGFGLIQRTGQVYSVQFRGHDTKQLFRSTGESARPRAITVAEKIIQDFYGTGDKLKRLTWEQVEEKITQHFKDNGLEQETVKDYISSLNLVKSGFDGFTPTHPDEYTQDLAQLWCNHYLHTTYTRGKKGKPLKRTKKTLHSRVNKLSALWNEYFIKKMKCSSSNPWENVSLPKLDKKPIRTLEKAKADEFFNWLEKRWMGWKLPSLLFEVKSRAACRLKDIAKTPSTGLKKVEGKFRLTLGETKTGIVRTITIPQELWNELDKMKGETFLWESYSSEMGRYLKLRGVPTHRINPEFDWERLVWWMKDEVSDFNQETGSQLQSHDFRKRFVTECHKAGLDVDTAAAGAGMTAKTARAYYLALDEQSMADEAAAKIGNILGPSRT